MNINGGIPNRISMKVTVPKQTQGVTFGEMVNAGLHAAGRASGGTATVPGAGVISAAVSSVSALAGAGSGAADASYARAGQVANAPAALPSRSDKPGVIDVLEPLADGDYQLNLVVQKATSGLKDTLKTQVLPAAPSRVEIVLAFSVEAGVFKPRHDVALNAIHNLR